MNKKISIISLSLVSLLALSSCTHIQEDKNAAAPTAQIPAQPQPREMTPLPATMVDAEFPAGYNHSYTFKHSPEMKFEVGMDTDVFSGSVLTQDAQQLVRINDLVLRGCKGDPADCGIDTAVAFTADEMYENQVSQISKDVSFKPLLVYPMPSNNLVQITAFEGTEDAKKIQMYLVNVGKGVVSVTFYEPENLPDGFIGDILASLRPSK